MGGSGEFGCEQETADSLFGAQSNREGSKLQEKNKVASSLADAVGRDSLQMNIKHRSKHDERLNNEAVEAINLYNNKILINVL